jgi:flagellar motor switch protein FliM
MKVDLYDFRKPGKLAPELEEDLGAWLTGACRLASERLAKELQFQGEMKFRGVEVVRAGTALAGLKADSVSYRLALSAAQTKTLTVFPRPLVLALAAAMVGDPGTELPADRELTSVEDSLFEYLVQCLLVLVLQEAWPSSEPLPLTYQHKEPNPKYARLFAADSNLVDCCFVIRGPFGELDWHWLAPQEALLEMFKRSNEQTRPAAQDAAARPRIEAFVRELPVEVAVRLGSVDLPLSMLADLSIGDLVILNQRVADPLSAFVAGEERFQVWPGRVGLQQAIQVESLLET